VVDERYGLAYRPIVSAVRALETRGFALTGAADEYDEWAAAYVDPPERYADAFWRLMERWLEAGAASGPTTTTTTLPPETIPPPPLSPPPAIGAASGPTETRLLLDGPTRRDAEAAAIVCELRGLRLAKRWKRAELLEEIEGREARRLAKAGLEEAIKAGMLTRKYPKGQERIDLTPQAKREVMKSLALSNQPFLRLEKGWLEFTKAIRTGSEILEVGISWLGGAELLWKAARETEAVRLREKIAELAKLPLLADTPEHRRELAILRMNLGRLAACSDALPILEYVLDVFGRDGRNPVEIPHWTLAGLLDHPRDHWPRVEMALNMLLVLNVAARETGGGGRERGALVSHWEYRPKGAGESTDGDWRIWLNDRAVGCLRVFLDPKRAAASAASAKTERLAKVKVKTAPKDKPAPPPEDYDWAKADLDKETASALRYWTKPTALAAFLPKAWKLTEAEAKLLDWRISRGGRPAEGSQANRPGLRGIRVRYWEATPGTGLWATGSRLSAAGTAGGWPKRRRCGRDREAADRLGSFKRWGWTGRLAWPWSGDARRWPKPWRRCGRWWKTSLEASWLARTKAASGGGRTRPRSGWPTAPRRRTSWPIRPGACSSRWTTWSGNGPRSNATWARPTSVAMCRTAWL
jgi:hypothetical protein